MHYGMLEGLPLGDIKGITPLNTPTPAGFSVVALSTTLRKDSAFVMSSLAGPAALYQFPFWDNGDRGRNRLVGTQLGPPPPFMLARTAAQTARLAAAAAPQGDNARFSYMYETGCLLCGHADTGPVHLCTTCTCPAIVAKRAATHARFPEHTSELLALLHTAHGRKPSRTLEQQARALVPTQGEGLFIMTMLLNTTAWTPTMCNPPGVQWPVAQAFAKLFSKLTPASRLRKFTTSWVRTANTTLRVTCESWHDLLSEAAHEYLRLAGFKHIWETATRRRRQHKGGPLPPSPPDSDDEGTDDERRSVESMADDFSDMDSSDDDDDNGADDAALIMMRGDDDDYVPSATPKRTQTGDAPQARSSTRTRGRRPPPPSSPVVRLFGGPLAHAAGSIWGERAAGALTGWPPDAGVG